MSDDRKAVRYRYALARLEDHLRGVWTYPSHRLNARLGVYRGYLGEMGRPTKGIDG